MAILPTYRRLQVLYFLCPAVGTRALSNTAIRPAVCPSCPRRAAALGYRHAGCLQCSSAMCGLRTRPRTDVDPPRVELPSAAHIVLPPAPGAITCSNCFGCKHIRLKVKFSHTRYRALGPELMPVYRQSARR